MSAIAHAVVLILLGISGVASQAENAHRELLLAQAPEGQEGQLDSLSLESALAAEQFSLDAAMEFAPDQPIDLREFDPVLDTSFPSLDHAATIAAESDLARDATDGGGAPGGGGGEIASGRPGDASTAGNGGKSASFFGIEAAGRRFVFVVDMSGSMNGRRFTIAKRELRKSLRALAANQSYFIVFFNTGAFPMPADNLLPATNRNRIRTERWINQAECGGFTDPAAALKLAFKLEPDSIFFLTDGEFDPAIVDMVEPASTSESTPVNTIAFQSREGESLLQAISKKTRGVYRFVK